MGKVSVTILGNRSANISWLFSKLLVQQVSLSLRAQMFLLCYLIIFNHITLVTTECVIRTVLHSCSKASTCGLEASIAIKSIQMQDQSSA